MSKVSKQLAAFALAVILTTGSAFAKPSQDPGSDAGTTIGSRIVKLVKHLVKVVIGTGDDMSIPIP